MDKIQLADGTELQGHAGIAFGSLCLTMNTEEVSQHLLDLMNPEKLETITAFYTIYKTIYHGFNKFGHLEKTNDGKELIVWLHGDNSSIEQGIPTVPEEYLPKEI